MANLQVKGIDDGLYEQMKRRAAAENRSVSQEVIFLLKAHLSLQKALIHALPGRGAAATVRLLGRPPAGRRDYRRDRECPSQ